MINCSITSRLDYCNSLLYGAKGYNISQLQLCQNNAARMLSLRRKFDHITPVLKDLHWLPVEQRIEYKVLLLTYKALHGKAPAYISQLLSLYTPTRPLRSENKNLLRVPRCRLEGFGRRCFAYAAPSLWNPLPTPVKCASSIDTLKSSLKTYLFNVAYPSIHWLLYCMSMLFVTLFKCFLFKSAFEHGDFSPFLKLALYKCNIIIIIIIIIKMKHFARLWSFVWGILPSLVDSPHKGQWRGALMFSLICTWKENGWASNQAAGDLRRHRAHYDGTVMIKWIFIYASTSLWWRSGLLPVD